LDLRQLRYFATVARAGSFMAASRTLRISQPALGYQVKQLEDSLDITLFVRHSRGVALTEPGKKLLHHADAILNRVRAAEEAILPFQKKPVASLSLGVTRTSGRVLSPDILAGRAERTRLRIAVHQAMSQDLLRQVESRKLDMAFCYEADRVKKEQNDKTLSRAFVSGRSTGDR
jgi:LysR family transcriptional regulator, nitrogen assimilation regulatory protein